MIEWWPSIGQTSLLTGFSAGLLWSWTSTLLRRRKYVRAGRPSFGQLKWFTLNFMSMGAFVSLATALGLASLEGLIPRSLFWFLLGSGLVAFAAALMFPSVETPLHASHARGSEEPPADPPQLPIRRSA